MMARAWLAARRAGRACLVVSAFAWFWGGAILLAWSVLPLVALFTRAKGAPLEVARIRNCQRVVSATFRVFHTYMRAVGLLDARVLSVHPRVDQSPVVFVANHPTLVDVTAIMSHFPHICCMAGSKYTDHPLFGRLLRLCGFIGAGGDLAQNHAGMNLALRRLNEGFDVLVFPEGTRSPPHRLGPFQRGAFEIALRAQVPILPFLLRCEPSALTKDRPFWKQPDTMAILSIEAGQPLSLEGMTQSRQLRERAERSYRELLCLAPETA